MKDQLLSIADYIESLEQRIAALESANIALQDTINGLQDNLSDMEARLADMPQQDPEVEVELLLNEEEEASETPKTPDIPEEPESELTPAPEPAPTLAPEPEPEPEIPEEPEQPVAPEPEPTPTPAATPAYQSPILGPQVTDIRQAISLGDRFLFQRELFANNGEQMQQTLDELNACANIEAAMSVIARFDWNQETTTYKLFINVLKRRF